LHHRDGDGAVLMVVRVPPGDDGDRDEERPVTQKEELIQPQ